MIDPLNKLRLDSHKVDKLGLKLHEHSVQYAYKLYNRLNLLAPAVLLRRAMTTHDKIVRMVALLDTFLALIDPCSLD